FYFFFFQAEDGIRDLIVTGVQTCALPILREVREHRHVDVWGCGRDKFASPSPRPSPPGERELFAAPSRYERHWRTSILRRTSIRSEERRVGKECRSQWAKKCEKKIEQRED